MINFSDSQATPAADLHAFVVDDEAQILALTSRALTDAGFSVRGFSQIAGVEAALTQIRPSLIVLDLSLGGTDAVEVMRSLAASRFGGKILLLSGHDASTIDEVQKIGKRYGLAMLPYLRKPFRITDLVARVSPLTESLDVVPSDVDLLAALQNNWLEVWYQPKFDLKAMAVCGAEALIRLRHPQLGMMPPSSFLPAAGDPLYKPLTDFVIRRALADWPSLNVRGNIRLAVNAPVSVLQSKDFVGSVRRHLPAHPHFPGLIVEITEDEAISDPELARETAIQLKLHNIHVSIDDFGAGFSSLSRLKDLPFVELKLDRTFVSGCTGDERKRSMCLSVVNLAHQFKMTAVAEGVETASELRTLRGMGYDMAQGYYFERPMTGADFIKLLASPASCKSLQDV